MLADWLAVNLWLAASQRAPASQPDHLTCVACGGTFFTRCRTTLPQPQHSQHDQHDKREAEPATSCIQTSGSQSFIHSLIDSFMSASEYGTAVLVV
jgi:hypothetical protein